MGGGGELGGGRRLSVWRVYVGRLSVSAHFAQALLPGALGQQGFRFAIADQRWQVRGDALATAEIFLDAPDIQARPLPIRQGDPLPRQRQTAQAMGIPFLQHDEQTGFAAMLPQGARKGLQYRLSDGAALHLKAEQGARMRFGADDGAAIQSAIAALFEIGLRAGDEAQRPALKIVGGGGEGAGIGEGLRVAVDGGGDAAMLFEAFFHQADGQRFDIDADPAPAEVLRGGDGRAAATEGIEDEVARVGGGLDDAFE